MDLSNLNEQQYEAVVNSYDNNVALLASAGSGKTTVLTKRIQYLIEEMEVEPRNIMAITFTNKAASEMKVRIQRETDAQGLWIGTFHSICVSILRKFSHLLPINKRFTILDGKDSVAMLKNVIGDSEKIKENKNAASNFISKISEYKNNYISPKKALELAKNDNEKNCALMYKEYYKRCQESHCLDFDDLILYTINLFKHEEVVRWFRKNIKYLLIDEYQDSNYTQILLSQKFVQDNNIFVVGDIRQSIYSFRNAKPEYFENFKEHFPNSKIMYLQRNYRSTQTIVNAGNDIISNNNSKLDLSSFTTNEVGDKIIIKECYDTEEEASFVASTIREYHPNNYNEVAILYSKHAQGIPIENELIRNNIPYEIVKGTSYLDKKEIKDILAILKLKNNPHNEQAFVRTCNQIDGMGNKTVKSIIDFKNKNDIDFFKACKVALDPKKKTGKKILNQLLPIINLQTENIPGLISEIYRILKIKEKYSVEESMSDKIKIENEVRYDNLMEFMNVASTFQSEYNLDLDGFLEKIALLGDAKEDSENCVKLMTIHASKGLEFDNVFIIGAEEGIIPNMKSLIGDKLKEQRRMMYVAVTRARNTLYISHCQVRESSGSKEKVKYSRFLPEINSDRYVYI